MIIPLVCTPSEIQPRWVHRTGTEYSRYFAKKQVVILPDNDEAGRKHALEVATSLINVCSTLRIVELPNSKDVSEWVQKGGSQESLQKLVMDAPPLDAVRLDQFQRKWWSANESKIAPQEANRFSILNLPSVWRLEHKLEWLVENFLAEGSVNLLSAESGTGKTWVAYFIAGAVARGETILNRSVKQRKTLYVDGENPLFVIKQRLHDLGVRETDDLKVWGTWNDPPPVGPNHAALQKFARDHKPLIVFDSLIEFHPGSEQSSNETRNFMRGFRELANLGATVLVLHHTGKAQTAQLYRGSSDIKASVDMAYHLKKVSEVSSALDELSITCFKGRLMPIQSFSIKFRKGEGFSIAGSPVTQPDDAGTEIIHGILESNPGLNQKAIVTRARAQKLSKHATEKLLSTGPWRTESGKGSELLYYVDDDCTAAKAQQNPGIPPPYGAGIRELSLTS